MSHTAWSLTLVVLFAIGGQATRAEDDEADDALHPTDAALVTRVKPLLAVGGTLATFEKALGEEAESVRDLGFGGRRHHYGVYGEELTLKLRVVSFDSQLTAVRVHSFGAWPALVRAARAAWGEGVRVTEGQVDVRRVDEELLGRLRKAVVERLGAPPEAKVPGRLRGCVERLTDPLEELTFGTACYEDGSPPEGREDALRLVRAADLGALGHVLRGPNPEGRVYAAEALLHLEREGEELGKGLKAALEEVVALETPIEACGGCLMYEEPAAALLTSDHLEERLLCRVRLEVDRFGTSFDDGEILVYADGGYAWRWIEYPRGPKVSTRWHRGAIPEEIVWPLFDSIHGGEGFTQEEGTTTYVLRRKVEGLTHPPGVYELYAHLLLPRR